MAAQRYLLDTNIISDLLKHPAGNIGARIATIGEEAVCTSIVVACELRYGAAKKGSPALQQTGWPLPEQVDGPGAALQSVTGFWRGRFGSSQTNALAYSC